MVKKLKLVGRLIKHVCSKKDVESQFTVDELKEILKELGQPVSGVKGDLIDRLMQYTSVKNEQPKEEKPKKRKNEDEVGPKKKKKQNQKLNPPNQKFTPHSFSPHSLPPHSQSPHS